MTAIDYENKNKQKVIDELSSIVTNEFMRDVKAFVDESGYTFDFKLIPEPIGDEQSEDYVFGSAYINQTKNGGYSGDDFAGTVCIPVKPGCFLFFRYEM